MDFFRRKTVAEILAEIRNLLEVIAGYPEKVPTSGAKEELVAAAQGLAKRVRMQLNKVDKLGPNVVLAMQSPLRLIEQTGVEQYERLKHQAVLALNAFATIEQAYRTQVAQKASAVVMQKMVRGRMTTYGRMMTAAEYKRLVVVKQLESADPGQLIPAFLTTTKLINKFIKLYDKTAIRNIYSHLGGTGNVDYVVFFRTDIVPQTVGPARRWPEIIEVKFPHGTPVEVVQFRRV
jgi:hypothetical protein